MGQPVTSSPDCIADYFGEMMDYVDVDRVILARIDSYAGYEDTEVVQCGNDLVLVGRPYPSAQFRERVNIDSADFDRMAKAGQFGEAVMIDRHGKLLLFLITISLEPTWVGDLRSGHRGDNIVQIHVETPTLLACFWGRLSCMKLNAEAQIEGFRRKVASARAAAKQAAKNQNLSAIARAIAFALLDALMALVASLAVEALGLIQPIPPPRVLAAGGCSCAYVPLN